MTRFLYMRLSGPMQSWGSNSLFWHRGTEFFPTKSGVLGLLFCAMGKGGPQTEALGEIAGLPQKVLQLGPSEGKHRQVAILTDFHMVGNGYDENDPWQLECVPKLIGGKNRSGGGEKLTKREYLQDASFAVIQEIPDAWSAAVEAGLKVPVWDVYLGRKCCPPALPVFGGIFETEAEALAKVEAELPEFYGEGFEVISIWEEASLDDPAATIVRDVPLSFGKAKVYTERGVIRKDGATLSKG